MQRILPAYFRSLAFDVSATEQNSQTFGYASSFGGLKDNVPYTDVSRCCQIYQELSSSAHPTMEYCSARPWDDEADIDLDRLQRKFKWAMED